MGVLRVQVNVVLLSTPVLPEDCDPAPALELEGLSQGTMINKCIDVSVVVANLQVTVEAIRHSGHNKISL